MNPEKIMYCPFRQLKVIHKTMQPDNTVDVIIEESMMMCLHGCPWYNYFYNTCGKIDQEKKK